MWFFYYYYIIIDLFSLNVISHHNLLFSSGSPMNRQKLENHKKLELRKELEADHRNGNATLNRVREEEDVVKEPEHEVVLDDVSSARPNHMPVGWR